MLITKVVRILDRMLLFKFQSMKIPIEATVGISARIKYTTDFVIFLDYDNITDDRLIQELLYLQELHRLGDFYIFKTNEFGRHAICIDRLSLRKALAVIRSSTCDEVFKRGIRINEYRTWVLRSLGKGNRPKPQYLYRVSSRFNGHRLQSQAHGKFLIRHFRAKVRLMNPDGNDSLEISGYKTANKTDKKDVKG